MKISEVGLRLIRLSESLRLSAYQDQVEVWTIGYGHTKDVEQHDKCTEEQAEAWLAEDVVEVEDCINRHISRTLSQPQFDSLCSFIFNFGCYAFRNSTLCRLINSGEDEQAAQQFQRWIHIKIGGKEVVSPGLMVRRDRERDLFLA